MVFSWVQNQGHSLGRDSGGSSPTNHVGTILPNSSCFLFSSFPLFFFSPFLFFSFSSFPFSYFLLFPLSSFPLFLKRCPEPHQYWKVNGAPVQHYVVESSSPQVVWCRPHKPHYPGSNPWQNHNTAGFKYIFTYLWYWAWRKLNSSLIRSIESTMFSLKGPPCGPVGPPCPPGTYKKDRQKNYL